jgi:hypothetical protein
LLQIWYFAKHQWGILGAGNNQVSDGMLFVGDKEIITNHSIAQDAEGYLFNSHKTCTGYHYVPATLFGIYGDNHSLVRRIDGLRLFRNIKDHGVANPPRYSYGDR